MRPPSARPSTRGANLAPLEDVLVGVDYEGDWKQDAAAELQKLYDGTVEFERTDGERRSMESLSDETS